MAPAPAPGEAGGAEAGIRSEGLSGITPVALGRGQCQRREDLVEAVQCMSDHYHEIGRKEQRNRWRKALRAIQCDGGMSLERAERRVLMGSNASLWRRVVEAIRACNAPVPSVGFTPLQYEGGATPLRLMGGGGLTVSNNAQSVTVTGPGSAELTEGGYVEDLTTTIVVELAGTEPDPGTFRVVLSGLDGMRTLGLDVSDSSDACSSTYSACANDGNCFCVTSQSGQTSTLGLTGQVHRASFEIEFVGATIDDDIVAPDATHTAGIDITSVNGTAVSTSAGSISLTVNEDDIAIAVLDTIRAGTSGVNGPHILVRGRVNRQVRGGFNLSGNVVGARGNGGSFWEIREDGSDAFLWTTGPKNDGKWELDCSDGRNPRFENVDFGPQLNNIDSDHFVLKYWTQSETTKLCP